jgi:hypothetical protein
MAATGDPRWVPYLLDLMGPGPYGLVRSQALDALPGLTGLAREERPIPAYLLYGEWARRHRIDPGTEYPAFKRSVYRSLDDDFDALLASVPDRVTLAAIQWGGVPVGGIPDLRAPARSGRDALGWADRARPDELVLGAEVDGEAVGYPVRVLAKHELANDAIAGRPVALAYCTLCRTAMLFDRRVGGTTLTFRTSGLLIDSNKVMVDDETSSLWRQLSGEAIGGPLTGSRLESLPVVTTTLAAWWDEHPTATMLELPEPWLANGDEGPVLVQYAYVPNGGPAGYDRIDGVWFPVLTPPAMPLRAEVVTMATPGAALALELGALRDAGPLVVDVGGDRFLVVPTPAGARAYAADAALALGPFSGPVDDGPAHATLADGRRLVRAPSGQSYWFAWYGAHPGTDWWPR